MKAPDAALLLALLVGGIIGLAFLSIIVWWVARDARRRGMDPCLWGTLIFLLLGIMLPVYLMLRKPLANRVLEKHAVRVPLGHVALGLAILTSGLMVLWASGLLKGRLYLETYAELLSPFFLVLSLVAAIAATVKNDKRWAGILALLITFGGGIIRFTRWIGGEFAEAFQSLVSLPFWPLAVLAGLLLAVSMERFWNLRKPRRGSDAQQPPYRRKKAQIA